MTPSEWSRWRRYWNEEPWGTWRDNAHAGLIAAAVLNPYRKKGAKALGFDAFMLKNQEIANADNMNSLLKQWKGMARPRAERDAERKAARIAKKRKGKK